MLVVKAPISKSATTASTPWLGRACINRPAAMRAAWDSMSMTTAFRPAASASPCPSWTFPRREAANPQLDIVSRRLARPDYAKVQTHFIQRERDVLVGFGFDLDLQFL